MHGIVINDNQLLLYLEKFVQKQEKNEEIILLTIISLLKTIITGFKIVICELRFVVQLCLFADHFEQIFVKFLNQNFPSVRTFFFNETKKFLFTLQTCLISMYSKL